jgi:uncharacterized membrane protein YozB (DUF420 family)
VTVYDLPAVNATLNATSAVLLTVGFLFIRARKVAAHRACMVAAFATSIVFLGCYLVYHAHVGSKPFPGTGWVRPLYFGILLSHTLLAISVPFLAGATLLRGLRRDDARHKSIARWTLPIWMYVSVTGVVVYWMLYRL